MLIAATGLVLLIQQEASESAAVSSAAPATATRVDEVFPAVRRFPLQAADGSELPSADFERNLRRLVEQPLGKLHEVPVRLGDVVRACAAADWDRAAIRALLLPWQERMSTPDFERVRDLLDCWQLYLEDWNPDSDSHRAGFYFGPTWELSDAEYETHSGDHEVLQSACLLVADMQAYAEAARQWEAYFDFVGGSYESLRPLPQGHCIERDGDQRIVAETLRAAIDCDLPFPFGGYRIDLRMLHQVEADGAIRGWFVGDSEDLHWYAGYDLFVPVYASDGVQVALLQLRQTGVDVDGVPERARDRRNGMRTVVRNLRLRSEARFSRRREQSFFDSAGGLPHVPYRVPLD